MPKTLRHFTLAAALAVIGPLCRANPEQPAAAIAANQLLFDFSSQDGEVRIPCEHQWLDNAQDWRVKCTPANDPAHPRLFTVHLRVFRFARQTSPKLAYQVLYWVTDELLPSATPGRNSGSTVWFQFNDESQLTAMELSQDIDNTNSLNVSYKP